MSHELLELREWEDARRSPLPSKERTGGDGDGWRVLQPQEGIDPKHSGYTSRQTLKEV